MTRLNPDSIQDLLRRRFTSTDTMLAGICDDDCAVWLSNDRAMVATTDYVNANPIGLQLGVSTFADLGYYLVGSNLSDLLGSGAIPEALLISIMWSRERSLEEFEMILAGVADASNEYHVPVVGGDTKLGRELSLCATAIGSVDDNRSLALQTQARVLDEIWVSGAIGSCAAATHGLNAGYGSRSWQRWAKARIRRPQLPWTQSRALSSLRLSPGGIDLSDGLAVDASTLGDRSGVGFEIDWSELPIEDQVLQYAEDIGVDGRAFAINVGGDLQFLATVPPGHRLTLAGMGLTRIGRVTGQSEGRWLLRNGQRVAWPTHGHSDYRGLSFVDEIDLLLRWSVE